MLPNLYPHMLNGFLLSVLLIVGLRPIARELRLLDLPTARKRHYGEVPLCGGLAIFLAFVFGGFGLVEAYRLPWHWLLGLLLLVLIGLADDRWRLPPFPRLAVQALAAAIMSAGTGALLLFDTGPSMTWQLSAPPLVGGLSLLFIVGTANAINMLDGVDGLAGITVAAALFWLAVIGAHVGDGLVAMQSLMMIAAVLGFLAFNARHPWRRQASIFLGDSGSMILGGLLATLILHLASSGRAVPAVSYVALLWLVILPICDTLSLVVRRVAASRSPLSSDRWHLHHLLLDSGVPIAAVAPIVGGISALCGVVAYCGIVFRVPDFYLALSLLVPIAAHTAFVIAVQGSLRFARPASDSGDTPRFQADTLARHTNEVIG